MAAHNITRASVLASELEVAGSLWAKFMGLMGQTSLAAGAGLWLPDSNGIHMMFMRFPIDAVFLGRHCNDDPVGSTSRGDTSRVTGVDRARAVHPRCARRSGTPRGHDHGDRDGARGPGPPRLTAAGGSLKAAQMRPGYVDVVIL